MARDEFDGLKCSIPGCKKIIRAMTGLQELEKLRKHVSRVHLMNWSMYETLENRVIMENVDNDKNK